MNEHPTSIIRRDEVTENNAETDKENHENLEVTVILPLDIHIRRILAQLNIRTCFEQYVTSWRLLLHPKE